jgi:hypothetical protein
MRSIVVAAASLVAACTPPAPSSSDTPAVDPEIAAVVSAAMPGAIVTSVNVVGEHDIEASAVVDGQDYEFDIVSRDGGPLRVVEIQRDIAWAAAPAPVRAVAASAPNTFEPARVIESRQPADGSIVYELFAPGAAPGAPTMEVRFVDGEAAVMPPAR